MPASANQRRRLQLFVSFFLVCASACIRKKGDGSEWFDITQGLNKGRVRSQLSLNVILAAVNRVVFKRFSQDNKKYMYGLRLTSRGARWSQNTCRLHPRVPPQRACLLPIMYLMQTKLHAAHTTHQHHTTYSRRFHMSPWDHLL